MCQSYIKDTGRNKWMILRKFSVWLSLWVPGKAQCSMVSVGFDRKTNNNLIIASWFGCAKINR